MLRDSGYSETSYSDNSGGGGAGGGGGEPLCRAPISPPPIASPAAAAMGTEERHQLRPPAAAAPVPLPEATDSVVSGEPGGHSDSRVTGRSYLAVRTAVATLNRLDDFTREKIGSGFFSEVFKVTHRATGNVMVLKMNLLRSNRPNMLKEVQLMNQLCHPNVLGFMGACVHEGQLHALTEYINGGSLEQLIQTRSVELTYCVRMKLALDIAKGMEYLHSRDVFHRDLTSKNVLIKKNEATGDLTAVVGDFGLAAKIPRAGGYRLPTVGSPYWMSPECLKGHWYDQSSDVFSYGIILCELIARVEADPDVLPRTENFGLDYLAFVDLCSDPPADFLKLALSCCTFEPKNRPTFSEIVIQLERSLETLVSSPRSALPSVVPSCVAVKSSSIVQHRSEEVLPTTESALAPQPPSSHRKLTHRRSLSEDVGLLVFPPHTAPSDKARCHFLSVVPSTPLKHVGEEMAREDPHYKPFPSKANPFSALGQFKGVKILASMNSTDLFSSCFELPSPSPYRTEAKNPFDLTFESGSGGSSGGRAASLPSDSSSSSSPPNNNNNNNDNSSTSSSRDKEIDKRRSGCDSWKRTENSVLLEPVVKPSHILKSNQNKEKQRHCSSSTSNNSMTFQQTREGRKTVGAAGSPPAETGVAGGSAGTPVSVSPDWSASTERTVTDSPATAFHVSDNDRTPKSSGAAASFRVEPPRYYAGLMKTKPMSLPSSPTFSRRRNTMTVLATDLFTRFASTTAAKSPQLSRSSGSEDDTARYLMSSHYNADLRKRVPSLFAHPLFNKRVPPHPVIADDASKCPSTLLHPLRSCSSSCNLITALDDIPCSPLGGLTPGVFFHPGQVIPAGQGLRRRGSCESGFFSNLGEDFCMPGVEMVTASSVTLSSSSAASSLFLDSGATVSCSLEDIATPLRGHSTPGPPLHMTQHKRSSSVYTDSSEDISSLGGSDLPLWDDRNTPSSSSNHSTTMSTLQAPPQQISKIVEYFERKQSNLSMPSCSSRWDPNSPGDFGSYHGLHHRQYQLHHREYYQLRRCYMQQQQEMNRFQVSPSDAIKSPSTTTSSSASSSSSGVASSTSLTSSVAQAHKRGINQRLMICEGAVRSKLPLFDKKMND